MSATDAPLRPGLAAILARLAAGRDAAAWSALLADVGVDLRRLAGRLVGEAALADDAMQEALLQIRDRAGRFTPAAGVDADQHARRWVMRLTANICISLLRSRGRASR